MAQYLDKEGLEKALSVVKEYIDTLSDSKQDSFTVGTGLSLTDGVLSNTLDTTIFQYVSSLPTSDIDENKIYVVLASSDDSEENNLYEEYYWNTTDGDWEKIGSFNAPSVDVSVSIKNRYGIIIGNITVDDNTFAFYAPRVNYAPSITSGTLLGYLQYEYGTSSSLGTYSQAIYAPTTDLSDYYTQSETDEAIANSQYWSLSDDTLTNTSGDTVSIANDMTVGGDAYIDSIVQSEDSMAYLWRATGDGTYNISIGQDARDSGQTEIRNVYIASQNSTNTIRPQLGKNNSTGTNETFIGQNTTTGTTIVRIGQNDAKGTSSIYLGGGTGSGTKSITIGTSTTYPISSLKIYSSSSTLYGTTTFKSVAYGVTPDSDAEGNELVTAEWVKNNVATVIDLDNYITTQVTAQIAWTEID